MAFDVTQKYDKESFTKFLQNFLLDDFEPKEEKRSFDSKILDSENSFLLGTSDSLDLAVYEFCQFSEKDPRVSVTKETVSLMKKYCPKNNVLAVFYNKYSNHWRFSLITSDAMVSDSGRLKQKFSNPKRYSFLLGEGCKRHTPESMFFENGRVKKVSDLEDLRSRFSVESVTKEFYSKLFAWYEWALECVKYPFGVDKKVKLVGYKQDEKLISTHIIRLITRLIFVWFIKQKDLVPKELFDKNSLAKILNNFGDEKCNSLKDGTYYNAILQNLFFATLNNQIEERAFAEQGEDYTRHFGIKTLFRDGKKESYFKISHEEFIELFSKIPYLNGGLFECLDHFDEDDENHNRQIYVDGFSAEDGRKAFVPNALFFDEEKGIIPLLKMYNFTVEESTPSDIQVALDPELLGKVFENLLGAYNPETSESARKDSGSFYTPREIVEYMVNESLKAHLLGKNVVSEEVVNALFGDGEENPFDEKEGNNIADALKKVRVLDPACGSGAFPMGMLNRLVELLLKIKPAQDVYRLKLDLIQNCIYGIDIQPIAVQISKLRFFISLICEQEKTSNADENYGINTLPNLETKIVCANSLIGVKRNRENHGLFHNDEIDRLESELLEVRNKHIIAKSVKDKFNLRKEDRKISKRLVELLKSDNEFGESNDSAEMLAKWNPYDQNAQSPFFDAEWMFGIKDGFDIVIGNPPYISTKGVTSEDKKKYEKEFGFSDDTYNLFTHKGLCLTKENGTLNFIIPKTFWTTQTKRNMRDLILNRQINYIFDTADPFESAMVDTCVIQIQNTTFEKSHRIHFYDGSENLNKPKEFVPVAQNIYRNTQNAVIFKPTEQNLRIYEKYGKKVKELYDTWWDKIKTSKDIEKNRKELEKYRNSLKPGDVALLGCLTDGGVGLQTGNNGKYIAVRKSTKWAANIIESRPKKLAEALKKYNIKIKGLNNLADIKPFLERKSESEIADLFDKLKEKYGRDIFGQGYIYKLIADNEIADVDKLTQNEKENGIDRKKKTYVPYDKGDKDGNRWYLETPFAIAWSKENVQYLKTDPKARYQGYAFYFREGFCWNNVLTTYIKCRLKEKTVHSTESMTFFSMSEKIPEYYLICIMNSRFVAFFVDVFINSTSHCTTGDAKLIPVVIPQKEQLEEFKEIFENAVKLKKSKNSEIKLKTLERKLNEKVAKLYGI